MRISDWSSDVCSSDLLTNQSDGNLDWVLGLYYFDVVGGYDPWQSVGGGFFWGAEQSTRAWAGYGQATLRLNSGTSVTGGLRWTTETLKMWRSEERRVGKECISTCRSRRSRFTYKKKTTIKKKKK